LTPAINNVRNSVKKKRTRIKDGDLEKYRKNKISAN
jgi:hypothetical protein